MIQGKPIPRTLAQALIAEGMPNHFLGGVTKTLSGLAGQVGGLVGGQVGGLVNPLIQGLGLNNNFSAFHPGLQPQDIIGRINTQNQRQTDVYNQQQSLAQALLAQSQGMGPNPAAAMLAQQSGNNVQQQSALMASMRGASANPALIARLAAQQGAQIQQDATGQAATMQVQQQLAAQQALQQQQAQMANQAISGEQTQLNYLTGGTSANAQVSQANQQTRNQLIGGLLNAGGAALGKMNDGGVVEGPEHVKGDSEENDVVPALLSAGEVVIPKSIIEGKNAPEKAKQFVQKLLEEKGGFEGVVRAKKSLKERVESLEKMACGGYVKKMSSGGLVSKEIDWDAASKWDPKDVAEEKERQAKTALDNSWAGTLRDIFKPQGSVFEEMPVASAQPMLAPPEAYAPPQQSFAAPTAPSGQALSQMPGLASPTGTQSDSFNPMGEIANIEKQYGDSMMRQASAEQAQQQETAKIYDKSIKDQEDMLIKSQQNQERISKNLDQLSSDVAANKIDPNKYWSSKSTGSKVSTVIGVMLSGIGAGLTGQSNMAWAALENEIERDIQSQKDEVGRKQTLFSDNLRMLGDMRAADQATRLQYASIVEGKIAKIAAQSNDPLIQERAKQAILDLRMKSLPLKQEYAQKQMQNEMIRGALKAGRPEQMLSLIPDKTERAKATEELEMVNRYKTSVKDATSLYRKAGKLSALSAADPTGITKASSDLAIINADLEAVARQGLKGQGTLQENEIKRVIAPFLITAKDLAIKGRVNEKMHAFNTKLAQQVSSGTPVLTRYGIPVDTHVEVEPEEEIQTMGGRPYKKVSGGWIPAN